MVYADGFRARQLYDKLCARHLGVGAKRLDAQHRCALRVAPVRFERLKRPHEHLRGARHGHRQRDRLAFACAEKPHARHL